MIEFILLFGLGFLSAGLVALLIAPSIHRSIVRFTENRLKATMPLSPEEVRAQKDMVRAVLAAENARTSHDLVRERDRIAGLMVENNGLTRNLLQAVADKNDMLAAVEEMRQETHKLRSVIDEDNAKIEALKTAIANQDAEIARQAQDINQLVRRRDALLTELDNLKIEHASNITQIENLNIQIGNLREERETARKDWKTSFERAKDLELRLVREENKVTRLEEKLQRETALIAEKTNSLERRASEIGRLKERLKDATWEARESARTLKSAGLPVPAPSAKARPKTNAASKSDEEQAASPVMETVVAETMDEDAPETVFEAFDAARFAEDVRSRNNALTQVLLSSSDGSKDDALREEIAEIAADLIVLTAANEGPGSPVRASLAGAKPQSANGRLSLADRANTALSKNLG